MKRSPPLNSLEARLLAALRPLAGFPLVRWIGLLGLTAAYLQGGLVKLTDFAGASAEMAHFGLAPASAMAALVIVLELGASAMILSGVGRWAGALALAGFTLLATLLANRYWEMAGEARFLAANAFYEHLGLVGGFLMVARWDILRKNRAILIGEAAEPTPV